MKLNCKERTGDRKGVTWVSCKECAKSESKKSDDDNKVEREIEGRQLKRDEKEQQHLPRQRLERFQARPAREADEA